MLRFDEGHQRLWDWSSAQLSHNCKAVIFPRRLFPHYGNCGLDQYKDVSDEKTQHFQQVDKLNMCETLPAGFNLILRLDYDQAASFQNSVGLQNSPRIEPEDSFMADCCVILASVQAGLHPATPMHVWWVEDNCVAASTRATPVVGCC